MHVQEKKRQMIRKLFNQQLLSSGTFPEGFFKQASSVAKGFRIIPEPLRFSLKMRVFSRV